jgi:ATP-dependent DNA helicase RecQ
LAEQVDIVRSVLRDSEPPAGYLTGPHRRLVDAVHAAREGAGTVGESDIAALLRQVLRHEKVICDSEVVFDVPIEPWMPPRDVLASSGIEAVPLGIRTLRLSAPDPWHPSWIRGNPGWIDLAISAPDGVLAEGVGVPSWSRPADSAPMDPVVDRMTSLGVYRSKAQGTALRTVALAPPGATVHVVLPTGFGKSLVGAVPGLLVQGATTVVVVPTIALAIDQERAAHSRFPRTGLPPELAYWGARDPAEKEAIRRRLADGTQRLVFASPEALLEGLSTALHQLARNGGLRYLVVDEAHLIRTWGLDFRPDFQLVAGLRSELAQIAMGSGKQPPTTVLMTATLSQEGLALDDALFPGEPSLWVASTFLRTEPRYLLATCDDEEERRSRLVEALRFLPRPSIVYTTRPQAAETIAAYLRTAGFRRVAAFHGETDGPERLRIMRAWSGDGTPTTVDVVVGTSAFGLGVDQPDVRTIIHACVPGSVDRFYQEVGRSGRDGHASVALWIPVPGADLREAQGIEGSTVIGDEKAWLRWTAMRLSHRRDPTASPDVLIVDTSAVPTHLQVPSEKNRLWNRNTLTLLARAGALELLTLPPPRRGDNESDEEWEVHRKGKWQQFRDEVAVKLLPNLGNLDQETVDKLLGQLRNQILANQRGSERSVKELLAAEQCWGDVFAKEYAFQLQLIGGAEALQHPTPSCSGCPGLAHHGPTDGRAPLPVVPNPSMPRLSLSIRPSLVEEMHGRGSMVVWYPIERSLTANLDDLVRRCVSGGVRALYVPPELQQHEAISAADRWASPQRFVVVETSVPQLRPFAVPSLILVSGGGRVDATWLPPSRIGAPRIVVVPQNLPDPEKWSEAVARWRTPSLHIDEFLRRV